MPITITGNTGRQIIILKTEVYEYVRKIYHSHNCIDGYRRMRTYLEHSRYSYSATIIHKYMKTELWLRSIICPKKPGASVGKSHKVFENRLKQDFTTEKPTRSGVWISPTCS